MACIQPILIALAERYDRSQAGRTGVSQRDLLVDYEELLASADCRDGESRQLAERALRDAEQAGILRLEHHRRDRALIQRVRFSPFQEAALYALLQRPAPGQRRAQLAAVFNQALHMDVPETYRASWIQMCQHYRQAALDGEGIQPFDRNNPQAALELLNLLARALAWPSESMIRFASCVLCGNSKTLEAMQPALEQLLPRATGNTIHRLRDVGIVENPRFCAVRGTLRLRLNGQWLDLGLLHGVSSLSVVDIESAEKIETDAARCLTIENPTTLLELGKLETNILMIGTNGYAGSGVIALLRRLPDAMEYWHFGDSDPAGFDILRDLRERTGRPFKALHMHFRDDPKSSLLTADEKRTLQRLADSPMMREERDTLAAILSTGRKGQYEQESLGIPVAQWPFYE